MTISSLNLQKGDLCAVTYFGTKMHPAIFHKDTGHSFQFLSLSSYTNEAIKKGEKPSISYVCGGHYQSRAVKIGEDCLHPADLALYQEFKKL
jgi:hypothetical protein